MNLFTTMLKRLLPLMFIVGSILCVPANAKEQLFLSADNAVQAQAASFPNFARITNYIRTQQRALNRKLAKSVRELKRNGSPSAAYTLILASLLYGFFHAAGPGHGKAVISGYLLASRQTIRRGIMLAFAASFLQAISAIIIVMVLVLVLKATGARISEAIGGVTRVSYGLIVLAGLGVLWTTLRTSSQGACQAHTHEKVCSTCGHAHMPDPDQLEKVTSLKTMAAIIFAVGIRPCTGAVLMLILAFTHGILMAGLVATFAMSLGTAITVSILAALTLGVKQGLLRMFSGHSQMVNLVSKTLGILAGICIVIIGLTLLFATSPKPFI